MQASWTLPGNDLPHFWLAVLTPGVGRKVRWKENKGVGFKHTGKTEAVLSVAYLEYYDSLLLNHHN